MLPYHEQGDYSLAKVKEVPTIKDKTNRNDVLNISLLNFLESARESLKKSELTRAVEDEGEGSKPKEPQARRTSKRIADKAQAMEHRPSSWNMSPTFSRSLGLLFQFMFA
ncbi:hypothetical protein BCR41DRAFT_424427 [Lobosporangium transversale]|uniref:Uncharacterized protein n=1 Tax=Lobosporangium transversale TaxID=64571 RepID=A0A1Y2GIC1_9FUNG|nr:hypothetical protein BCR41DRAFT_424427 [Lobosporangium transversale]ORZ08452.1 hypothetical protein BCR41DRAFT_424427 [Lobosporangium transversale]|eukprot:XP_021878380.1 hypothetical protein BCR41DRAFT_424427 [Lobosporangium transversale]